jgi:hypothetical protein
MIAAGTGSKSFWLGRTLASPAVHYNRRAGSWPGRRAASDDQ